MAWIKSAALGHGLCSMLVRTASILRPPGTSMVIRSMSDMKSGAKFRKLTPSDSTRLGEMLGSIVGEKGVSLAEAVRSQHGQDEGPEIGHPPDVVVYPRNVNEISEVG